MQVKWLKYVAFFFFLNPTVEGIHNIVQFN